MKNVYLFTVYSDDSYRLDCRVQSFIGNIALTMYVTVSSKGHKEQINSRHLRKIATKYEQELACVHQLISLLYLNNWYNG